MQQDNPRDSGKVAETKQRVYDFASRFLSGQEIPVETYVHPVNNPQIVCSELYVKKDHKLVVRSMVDSSEFLDVSYFDFSSSTSVHIHGNMSPDFLAELVNRVIDEHSG